MDANTAHARRNEVTLLDVRENWEREMGRIEGSLHLPLTELVERVDEVPEDKPVVALCLSGNRSEKAAGFLRTTGRDAHNLDGGVKSWIASQLPFEGKTM
jgi:rhodanese-related sulfurtransferase